MNKAIVKLVVLAILFVNQILIVFGFEPLPFDEEQIYEFVSTVLFGAMSLYTLYFNNDFTPEAREGTEHTRQQKAARKGGGGKPQ